MRRGLALLAALGVGAGLWGCAGSGPAPAWETPPTATRESPVVAGDRLHRGQLDNGLHVLALEDHRVPRVTLGVTVRRGGAAVPLDQAGLPSFTAELMKRGAGERDALALAEATDRLGASLGVGSDWDSMTVQVSGLSQDLDVLAEILADVALRPRFDPQEAESARSETLAALEKAKDNPGTLARWQLYRVLFEGHPYGIPKIGTVEIVKGFDAELARALHQRFWVPRNAIFFAVGDVDLAELEALAAERFGAWSGGEPPQTAPVPALPTPTSRRVVIVDRPDLVQAKIYIAHEGIRRDAPDRISVAMMNAVLGWGGFSSRIMSAVREEAGLAYSAYSAFGPRRQAGIFSASTATRVPEAGRAVAILLDELERIRSDPPDADELRHAKGWAVGRFSLGLETSDAIMDGLVNLDVYGLPEDSLDTYRARVRAVSLEQATQAARDHVHPERAVILVVGPADALRPQLEAFGPVEVVTP